MKTILIVVANGVRLAFCTLKQLISRLVLLVENIKKPSYMKIFLLINRQSILVDSANSTGFVNLTSHGRVQSGI